MRHVQHQGHSETEIKTKFYKFLTTYVRSSLSFSFLTSACFVFSGSKHDHYLAPPNPSAQGDLARTAAANSPRSRSSSLRWSVVSAGAAAASLAAGTIASSAVGEASAAVGVAAAASAASRFLMPSYSLLYTPLREEQAV
jgi:hypothetical protein